MSEAVWRSPRGYTSNELVSVVCKYIFLGILGLGILIMVMTGRARAAVDCGEAVLVGNNLARVEIRTTTRFVEGFPVAWRGLKLKTNYTYAYPGAYRQTSPGFINGCLNGNSTNSVCVFFFRVKDDQPRIDISVLDEEIGGDVGREPVYCRYGPDELLP